MRSAIIFRIEAFEGDSFEVEDIKEASVTGVGGVMKFLREELVLSRISNIVDKWIGEREIFRKLDKTELVEFLSSLIEKLPPEQRMSVTDDELIARIEKIMLIEATAEIWNELTPEQKESFEAVTKRIH